MGKMRGRRSDSIGRASLEAQLVGTFRSKKCVQGRPYHLLFKYRLV